MEIIDLAPTLKKFQKSVRGISVAPAEKEFGDASESRSVFNSPFQISLQQKSNGNNFF
jgi:hypothetical protein